MIKKVKHTCDVRQRDITKGNPLPPPPIIKFGCNSCRDTGWIDDNRTCIFCENISECECQNWVRTDLTAESLNGPIGHHPRCKA